MIPLAYDQVVAQETAGGGGYGDPLERDTLAVRLDVEYGYVSMESARDDYGVVINSEVKVDEAATERLRKTMRGSRP